MQTGDSRGEAVACRPWTRLRVALSLLGGLRRHDLRAARSFMNTMYRVHTVPVRLFKFIAWALRQMLGDIPEALTTVTFARELSRTPIWLAQGNPLANHPWDSGSDARLPDKVDAVVIGAGMTGASCAYQWSKLASDRCLAVLEMEDPAWGASGRNEGLVVMGRYYAMVRDTVRPHLERVRADLTSAQRDRLAEQFAAVYVGSMCGSGTGVSFNAARHVVQQILELEGPNDYPTAYFAPTRLLDPANHPWPEIEA